MTIQVKIADLLITQLTASNNPLKKMVEGKTMQEVCQLIFINFRGAPGNTAKGLKLSDIGLQLLKTYVQSYDVFLGEGVRVTLPHLLYLDRISILPFYIDNKTSKKVLTTFDSDLAMMLKLADGKIDTLIETRFRLQIDGSSLQPDL